MFLRYLPIFFHCLPKILKKYHIFKLSDKKYLYIVIVVKNNIVI